MKRWDVPGDHGFFVYLLIDGGEVVYVGQSTSLFTRLSAHQRDKDFTNVRVYQFASAREMDHWESRLIQWLVPYYNKKGIPKHILDDRRLASQQYVWRSA